MKQVLILTQCFPPTVGGIEQVMGNMARTLADAGLRVTVFADAHPTAKDAMATYTTRRFGGVKFFRRWLKAKTAERYLCREDVPIVFCDSWKSLEYLRKPRQETVVTVLAHGSEYPRSPSPGKCRRIQSTLAKADKILAVSQATKARMQASGVDVAPVTIWHPPINQPTPPSTDQRQRAISRWQGDTPRLLTVARLSKRKGVDTAIRAVAQLVASYPTLRYIVAGEGPEKNKWQDLAKHHQIDQHIDFIGAVNEGEKSALYDSADLFVLPARPAGDDMEGFGLVFQEAAYCGLTAVAGAAGGATEAVIDGETGLHCDGNDVHSLKQAIERLLSDDDLRQTLANNARQQAQQSLWPLRINELLN